MHTQLYLLFKSPVRNIIIIIMGEHETKLHCIASQGFPANFLRSAILTIHLVSGHTSWKVELQDDILNHLAFALNLCYKERRSSNLYQAMQEE